MKLFLIAAAAVATLSVSAPCWARDVPHYHIQDNTDAHAICVKVCSAYGGWNGNWACNPYGVRCVCGCRK
jgi:hypothetical protein